MEEPRPEEPRPIDPIVPARRDSRAIRGATPHNPMRPVLIGVAVVAVLGGAIALAGRYQRAGQGGGADPAALVTPGSMHVEQTEVLGRGEAAPKPDADARGTGPMPVRFYEVLANGRQENAGQGSDIAMRSLPLPPPKDAAASPTRTAQAGAGDGGGGITEEAIPPAPAEETPAPAASAPRMKAMTAATAPTAPPAAGPDMPRPYTLQVSSFSRKQAAEKVVAELKEKGLEAYLAEADLGAKGVWYRVRVGRFPTEHAAKWARLDLVRAGLKPIVVHDPKGP